MNELDLISELGRVENSPKAELHLSPSRKKHVSHSLEAFQKSDSSSQSGLQCLITTALSTWAFPGGSEGKESACSAGDPGASLLSMITLCIKFSQDPPEDTAGHCIY